MRLCVIRPVLCYLLSSILLADRKYHRISDFLYIYKYIYYYFASSCQHSTEIRLFFDHNKKSMDLSSFRFSLFGLVLVRLSVRRVDYTILVLNIEYDTII